MTNGAHMDVLTSTVSNRKLTVVRNTVASIDAFIHEAELLVTDAGEANVAFNMGGADAALRTPVITQAIAAALCYCNAKHNVIVNTFVILFIDRKWQTKREKKTEKCVQYKNLTMH